MDIFIFFSKYLILLFIGLLVFSSFVTMLQESNRISTNLKSPSMLLTIIFHIFCSIILVFRNNTFDLKAFVYCNLIILFIIVLKAIIHFLYYECDHLLVNIMIFMLDISFIFLYRLNESNAIRQLIFASVAVICSCLIPFLFRIYVKGFEKFKHFDYVFIILIFGLLSLPFFYGIDTYGANNWAYFEIEGIGLVSFQPSEIVKLLFIFYLASAFARSKKFADLILPTVVSFFAIIFLVVQNDFGGSLMYFTIYMALLYITTSSKTLLALGISAIYFASIFDFCFVFVFTLCILCQNTDFNVSF